MMLVVTAFIWGVLAGGAFEGAIAAPYRRRRWAVQRGREAFERYNAAGNNPGKTHDGRPVPKWDELGDNVRAKWIAAANG